MGPRDVPPYDSYGMPPFDPYETTRRDPYVPAPDPYGGAVQGGSPGPTIPGPYDATIRDPNEATARDPYGSAAWNGNASVVRDPLEETVPDPVKRRKRLSGRQRRALEAAALLVLAPGLTVVRWVDDSHQAAAFQPPEHVTVVRAGQNGVLGHAQWRMLGRDATTPVKTSTTPAGAVQLTLLVECRPLDAQAVKNVQGTAYQLRDPAGRIWTGLPQGPDPAVGIATRLTVTAAIPERLVNSVVLEIQQKSTTRTGRSSVQGLVFAH